MDISSNRRPPIRIPRIVTILLGLTILSAKGQKGLLSERQPVPAKNGIWLLIPSTTSKSGSLTDQSLPPSAQIKPAKSTDFADYDHVSRLIHLEMSDEELASRIGEMTRLSVTNRYLDVFPFCDLLPYTNHAVVSEWQATRALEGYRPDILFAIYDSPEKKHLVDAFWYHQGFIHVMLNGIWNHHLVSLKPGDSMKDAYQKLGKRECNYYLAANGQWQVRFVYCGWEGRSYVIEARAADGIILSSYDGTL